MATSGSFQSNNEKYCNLYVEWKVTGQSIANNTSTVQIDVYLKHHELNIPSKTLTINFGSTVKNVTVRAINMGSWGNNTHIATATMTAWHNANGTKSLTIGVTMPIGATCDGTYFENVTATGTATFNTIARPTTPTFSASSVELGNSVTINMARNLSNLTHTLTYSIGSASGTIGSSLGTSTSWTPSIDLAHQITKSTSGAVTITCKTYSGSTLIGTKTATLTVKVPSSVVPTVSTPTFSDPTGYAARYLSYVQNQSKLKIDVNGAGAYSSTITSYKIEANGSTMTLDAAGSVTTGVLTKVGATKVIVTVTDSRGRTATYTSGDGQNNVIAYSKPKATISAYRCDSSGNENPEGAYIKATISGSITALNNKNSKTFKIQYKKLTDDESVYETNTALTYNSAYSVSTSKVFAADIDSIYNVRVVATDDFGSSISVVDVSTSYTIIDFKADGKGIAFGKVSTEEGFDVDMTTKFRQDVRSTKDVIAGLGESYQCSLIDTNRATQGIVAENLIVFPYNQTYSTKNGITWSDGGDGCVTAVGTASALSQFYFNQDTDLGLKPNTTYTLSGCPSGGSSSTYAMRIIINYRLDGQVQYRDIGNGVTFTTPDNYQHCRIMVDVNSGTTIPTLTFEPMLKIGGGKHTYQPYTLSRKYINERINKLQPQPYSLARTAEIGVLTTTQTTYNTFNSRKFSDYGLILITIGASHSDVRASLTIPSTVFGGSDGTNPKTVYIDCWSNSGNTFNHVAVKWVSDTSFIAYAATSGTVCKYLNIYGIKVEDAL